MIYLKFYDREINFLQKLSENAISDERAQLLE